MSNESPTAPRAEPAGTASGRTRVMVVDDNHEAAKILAIALDMFGAEAKVCHDGPAALALVETFNPQLIFLDIGMPGMDGHEVARRIRAMPRFKTVRIVGLSGWGQEEVRRRSAEAGFDEHLVKPIDISGLQRLLASAAR